MDNKALLWAKPDKSGTLLKRGGEIKSWKKRQFVIKDSYLFYFKVLASVEQSEPTGVIPLEGCKVGIAPSESQSTVKHVFLITLPEQLVGLGIIKRMNYVLAARDYEDLHSWIDAIKLASMSKRKLQAKVEHAYMERIAEAHARYQEASSHLTKIERAASMQEEMILAREDLGYLMSDIQSDMAACNESLEWLIPARFHFYTIERQFQYKGDEMLPDEKTIAQLGAQLASIYEEYMSILQCAIGSIQVAETFSQNFVEQD